MQSNSFGRFKQKIVVGVLGEYAKLAEKRLESKVRDIIDGYHYLEWTRLSANKGNDEEIIQELSMLLSDISSGSWKVVWKESVY